MIVTVTLNPSFDKSITINNFRTGSVNKIEGVRIDPGGKGINVSKVLNELGGKNIATGIAGRDNFKEYRYLLRNIGIRQKFIQISGIIRTNLKINDTVNGTTTDINEPGPLLDEYDLICLENLLSEYRDTSSVFVISGSISPDTEPLIMSELIEFLNSMYKKVIVDTSGKALKEAAKAKPYIIKPNIHELCELTGRELKTHDEIISCAKELIKTGIHGVMVTLGGDGLLYVTENSCHFSPGLTVNPKCTVGAGDAVTAAIAYSVENNMDNKFIVSLAASLGTAAVMTDGSQAPSLDDINHYMDIVDVIEL